jgi:hypothetical protein
MTKKRYGNCFTTPAKKLHAREKVWSPAKPFEKK